MNIQNQRNYNCKNEELPVMGRFLLFSLRNDLPVFTNFSPKYNDEYVVNFEQLILNTTEVVEPRSEILLQKEITAAIFSTLAGLIEPANKLKVYLRLANGDVNLSNVAFGLVELRKCINGNNAEGALKILNVIQGNLAKYRERLMAHGLTDELIALFDSAAKSVAANKQKQYELFLNRKKIVENNLNLFNGLYKEICDILAVGKAIFQNAGITKRQEYTFTDLKKRVRVASKPVIKEKPAVEPVQ